MKTNITITIAAVLAFGCDHLAEHAHGSGEGADHGHATETVAVAAAPVASPTELPEGVNAVQNEMRLLHEAMRDSVTAVANNDLAAIPHAIHRVHQARGMTDAAIQSGSYRPPQNGDQIEQFLATDEAFHQELVVLVRAANANDSAATGQQLGVVLSRCNGCHSQFRPTPTPPAREPAAGHEHHH